VRLKLKRWGKYTGESRSGGVLNRTPRFLCNSAQSRAAGWHRLDYMQLTERSVNDVTILDLDGRLTIDAGAELLRETIKRLLNQGKTKLLINLAKVPYVDSGGLGELVHCLVSTKKAHGEVKLMGLTSRITDLLAITRLVTVFDTFETEPDAMVSFGGTPVAVKA